MAAKIVLTACLLTFGVVVPVLEVNDTHVFNPLWPGHARLHEVWQLVTNAALAALCAWLAWRAKAVRLAAVVGACVTGGFVLAHALGDLYGGSMQHTDGSELAVGGINVAVVAMVLATAALLVVAARGRAGT